jgi:hypothetical protein
VYGGLEAYIELSKEMGWYLEDIFQNARVSVKRGIMQKLYNVELDNFNWAVDDRTIHISDWNRFYPDAFAQIFPIIYGIPGDDRNLEIRLWNRFNEIYKKQLYIPVEQQIVIDFAEKRMGK